MPACPNCGDDVERSFNFCRGCGTELDESMFADSAEPEGEDEDPSFRERVEEIREERAGNGGPSGGSSGAPASSHMDAEPQGDWVTPERIQKVASLLDDDEAVHYMWKGGTIDVEGSGAGTSIFGNDRDRKSSLKSIYTAVTSKRVVIYIPQFLGDDERHVPYHSITSVDLDTGLMARRVSLQTKGQTYHIQAQGASKDEIREAMQFIRDKVEETHKPQQVTTESEPDPTEQLKNLKELHEDGVLSDDEFAEKKAELLDKI